LTRIGRKRQAEVNALERATLYGIVIYSGGESITAGWTCPARARFLSARRWLAANGNQAAVSGGQPEADPTGGRPGAQGARQDVLVDDELIYAFYDQQLPADVCSGFSFEAWYRDEVKINPRLLLLTREELMRHEAAGITTQSFPKNHPPGRGRLRRHLPARAG
jgi:ATP-dependent helicase HrpA